jgi:carbon-monoxide dehydrogenase medium subunit
MMEADLPMNELTNSHILINEFAYLEPASLEEAISLLAQYGSRAKVLAGGTDLLVQMKMERIAPEAVIYIGKIPGLGRIETQDDQVYIGGRASIQSIEEDPRVQSYYPGLAEACASFSTAQIQVMGTIGGNLGNGSPASDSAPALIVYGAMIELTGPEGQRLLPLERFFTGPGKTVLQNGELITQVILPRPEPGTGSAFIKVTRVAADIAKASAAVMLVRDPHDPQRVLDCRIAFGSVAPTPVRARKAEALLIGQVLDEERALQVAGAAVEEISPIDDVRSTATYRREAVRAITYDALMSAWTRTGFRLPAVWEQESLPREAGKSHPGPVPALPIEKDERRLIELKVNGKMHTVWVSPNELLLNVLRDQLQLVGTKYGCGIGECSACTILMDGKPTLACLVLAVSAVGNDIQTIEGLESPEGELDPLQEAFLDFAAYQCGYCTPGMLMTAKSLLVENPHPTENDVRHYLRGNLCRCTGYASIVRAVLSCAEG